MKDEIMFVSTILVLGVCVLVSWLLVPYVCAGLEIGYVEASIIVNFSLYFAVLPALLFFARNTREAVFIILWTIISVIFAFLIHFGPANKEYIKGKDGFLVHGTEIVKFHKVHIEPLMTGRVFKAISPNGAVLVSVKSRTKYKEDSNREPEKTIVYAQVYDYDGNKLSEEEYDYNYDANFQLNEDRIKYIKMRLRVDKNIYLRHQIN